MNIKYVIILGLFIFLSVITLSSCGGGTMPPEAALKNFSKQIERGNLDNLRLIIYYMDPNFLTMIPMSVEDLVNAEGDWVQKVVIDGSSLEEHIGLLKQVGNITLIPVKDKSYINARIYYVFKTRFNRNIFDVVMWGENQSIFVNGFEVEANGIFYDLIIPFLPEVEANMMEGFKARINNIP
jgi:hypothetical protein